MTIEITGNVTAEFQTILTPDALAFVEQLAEQFAGRVDTLLTARAARQQRINNGELPDFLPETASIRQGEWKVGAIPKDLTDRRVEITGPVDRKMVINALNSGAKVFMADFEDSHSPTWAATMEGQINLRDAITRSISYKSPEGREYKLNDTVATLIVRPRGWHLVEKHMLYKGKPIPGALVDFGLYFFHNAKTLLEKGSGPYFYLPKMESHKEAALWNDVFIFAQQALDLPVGTIKVTVLIETILAAFEMEEILYALKDHIVALNCGRWDYIFSFIKKFHNYPEWVLPERGQVTMKSHFLESYSLLLIKTCHKRGAYAMGGMAAYIPVKTDPEANAKALENVRLDKEREARNGHDGTWVAHPGLVPVAMEVFDRYMPHANQVDKRREDVNITAKDLLTIPEGTITEKGLRNNISVSLQYIAAWLDGRGCVPIFNLMEDAATAEISRTQLWQWIKYPKGILDDGRKITADMFFTILKEESAHLAIPRLQEAQDLLKEIVLAEHFIEFITLPAYRLID